MVMIISTNFGRKSRSRLKQSVKRRRNDGVDEGLPSGKKMDEKVTPKKQVADIDDKKGEEMLVSNEVIKVFTVNVTEHMENVRKTSPEKIDSLKAIINSLDSNDYSNKLTIGTLTAQIAQIEMTRETSICSMNNMQSNTSSDIKIEKQRLCPTWTENMRYEPFRKQLENWNKKSKNDEATKYYEVLESLKTNYKSLFE